MFEQTEQLGNICSEILGNNYFIKKLTGGINNPTYLISKNNKQYVLKKINTPPSLEYDRYLAEKQFLQLSKILNCVNTPMLIHNYDSERILILEYIEADNKIKSKDINTKKIKECMEFIKLINSNKELSKKIVHQNAAESYKNITGHLKNIDSRIDNFDVQHLPNKYKENANRLLTLLKNNWQILKYQTTLFVENNPNQNHIDESHLIISPSDFGFHNIIINKEKLYFIDFEYSGWDDPAKLYCDFILQPKIQIPDIYHKFLKNNILSNEYINSYEQRFNILYKLLKFKWHTIKHSYLNEDKYNSNKFYSLNLSNINLKEYLNEIH